jgi:hypothetical protein
MAAESEKTIERYLTQEVKKVGGESYKFTSPNRRGIPDRICIFPPFQQGMNGPVWFIECKSTGQKLSPLQENELRRLANLGQLAAVIDSKAQVDSLIKKYHEVKNGVLAEIERNKRNEVQKEESRIIIPGRR